MRKSMWIIIIAVLAITSVAAGYRLYDIKEYPPGLFPDEAANGEDALLVLQGDVRPFYPRGNGREGLFFIMEAAAIYLFGIGVWQLHIVSAVVGVLTVFAIYWAAKPWFGRLAGVLAAFFMATSYWQVTLSRTGFRAILVPLFIAAFTAWAGLTIESVKKGRIKRSYLYAVLSGAALVGGFYTYIVYRVMIGVVAGVVALLILAAIHPKIGFPHFKRYGKQVLLGVVSAIIVLAPLAWFFAQNPADFVGRAGQVSIFNKNLQEEFGGGTLGGTLEYSVRETMRSFFTGQGDLNWRHNVAGFPLLNPLVGLLFLLGLAWAIRGFFMVLYKIAGGVEVHLGMIYAYMLLLLAGMLVPVVTTAEGMPHGLRSIGLAVPMFILAGTAGAVVIHWWQERVSKKWQGVSIGFLAGLLVLSGVYDGALYFLIAQNDSGAHYAYRADLTEVSEYINEYARENPEAVRPYLVLDPFSLQTVHFLTSVAAHEHTVGDEAHPDEALHKWEYVDPASSYTAGLNPGEIIIFTQSTMFDARRYEETHPQAELIETRRNRFNQEIMRVYTVRVKPPEIEGTQDKADIHFDLDA